MLEAVVEGLEAAVDQPAQNQDGDQALPQFDDSYGNQDDADSNK